MFYIQVINDNRVLCDDGCGTYFSSDREYIKLFNTEKEAESELFHWKEISKKKFEIKEY